MAEFDKKPLDGFAYAIDKNDIELFKKYYYLVSKKELVEKIKDANSNEVGIYYRYGGYFLIEALHNYSLTDKFFYDAIEFLEKEGETLVVRLFKLKPLLEKYVREGFIYDEEFMSDGNYYYKIKHSYVDRLCFIIKNTKSVKLSLTDTEGSDIFDFSKAKFENEEDALKLYDAFIYRYEKRSKSYDENIPNYKNLLKASFEKRRK